MITRRRPGAASPFQDQSRAKVRSLIDVFGAPIDANDAKTIVDYLQANYGSR